MPYPSKLKNRLLGGAKPRIINLRSLRSSILGSFRASRKADFSVYLGIKPLIACLLWISCLNAESVEQPKIVISTKRLFLEEFPDAWNPSMIKIDEGFLVVFRYQPDSEKLPWISYIGVVLLNDEFEPITKPELLSTRLKNSKTPSQSEDPRIFTYNNKVYVIYNDNVDTTFPEIWGRRDMFMAELFYENSRFFLGPPVKLIHAEKYHLQYWQKNWVPFEKEGTLLMTYTINPHEILYANLYSGKCYSGYQTHATLNWPFGTLRGSTPPQLVDGEYLAFFHSGTITSSPSSWGLDMWHYFMGAYTFSAEPPFHLTKISPRPIVSDEFYTPSPAIKRVVFPGSFVVSGSKIYVAYGKDDSEMWIATLDKDILMKSLIPVEITTDK